MKGWFAQRERAAGCPTALNFLSACQRLGGVSRRQRAAHGAEGVAQLSAEAGHCGDRGDRDQSSNKTVFDGGCALLVLEHLFEESHIKSPGSVFVTPPDRNFSEQAFDGYLRAV